MIELMTIAWLDGQSSTGARTAVKFRHMLWPVAARGKRAACSRGRSGHASAGIKQGPNRAGRNMRSGRAFAAAMSCLLLLGSTAIASEPKQGGIFRIYHRDSPGSASIHEGATNSINIPFM